MPYLVNWLWAFPYIRNAYLAHVDPVILLNHCNTRNLSLHRQCTQLASNCELTSFNIFTTTARSTSLVTCAFVWKRSTSARWFLVHLRQRFGLYMFEIRLSLLVNIWSRHRLCPMPRSIRAVLALWNVLGIRVSHHKTNAFLFSPKMLKLKLQLLQ